MGASRILSGGTIAGHLPICRSEQRERVMRVATSAVSDILYMAAARIPAAEGAGYDTVLTVENQHEPDRISRGRRTCGRIHEQ
jgi:hypothetical protein